MCMLETVIKTIEKVEDASKKQSKTKKLAKQKKKALMECKINVDLVSETLNSNTMVFPLDNSHYHFVSFRYQFYTTIYNIFRG